MITAKTTVWNYDSNDFDCRPDVAISLWKQLCPFESFALARIGFDRLVVGPRQLDDGIVETLVYNNDNSITTLDKKTLAWIESTSPEIREKLAKAGLIEVPPEHTVKELWDEFLKQKDGIEESTMKTYEASMGRFFAYFKGNETLGLTTWT